MILLVTLKGQYVVKPVFWTLSLMEVHFLLALSSPSLPSSLLPFPSLSSLLISPFLSFHALFPSLPWSFLPIFVWVSLCPPIHPVCLLPVFLGSIAVGVHASISNSLLCLSLCLSCCHGISVCFYCPSPPSSSFRLGPPIPLTRRASN